MKQIFVAVPAGAEGSPVRPHTEDRPHFAPAFRWDVLDVARHLRRDLKLTPGDLAVLQALLSFLPCKTRNEAGERPVSPSMLCVVFPSNASLAERAHDMDPRCLRRHLVNLETAGLIKRRSSANGKRFPLRSNGKIIDAFGIDLTPGFIALPALREKVAERSRAEEEARNLRSQIRAMRQELLCRASAIGGGIMAWLDDLGRKLRRSLDLDELKSLLGRLQAYLADPPSPARGAGQQASESCADAASLTSAVTSAGDRGSASGDICPSRSKAAVTEANLNSGKKSANNGQNVRHIEPEKRDYSKQDAVIDWQSVPALREYFPEKPKNYSELIYVLEMACRCIGLRQDSFKASLGKIGASAMLTRLNLVFSRADRIKNPAGYFLHLVDNADGGTVSGRPTRRE